MTAITFDTLSPKHLPSLWQTLFEHTKTTFTTLDNIHLTHHWLQQKRHLWRTITQNNPDDDRQLTDWLIDVFNTVFCHHHTVLVRGGDEPEYFASYDGKPAQIVFAHGYFASSLHEISHWCIAGKKRRALNDFGYWYAKDGRDKVAQQAFEQVEIKPQAIECLLTLACCRYFYVSQDNLNADFDTTDSTFAQDVHAQAFAYLNSPNTLPTDAKVLLVLLLLLCQDGFTL